jgi:hypothetical protein
METMRREVVALRSGVFPAWGRLQRLVRDTSGAVGVLQKGTVQEVLVAGPQHGKLANLRSLSSVAQGLEAIVSGSSLDDETKLRFACFWLTLSP